MEYRFLGATGLKVSELCLGAMTFGREADERTSHQLLDRFVDAGGMFIDTADVYHAGESERIVGRWLKTRSRDDLVIATKVYGAMGTGPNDSGAGRKHIRSAVEASLRRLGTDYIDLYQVHVFDDATPLTETLSTLDQLVTSGKVRFLGASNYTGWQLQKSIDVAMRHGWEPFTCLQPLYNLLDRGTELDLIPVCGNEGVGVIPWSPLRGGWLTGKYHRDMSAPPPDTRVDRAASQGGAEQWAAYANERTWSILDTLRAVAGETGRTLAQVALRWLLQRPAVTAPIIGARNRDQLDDNLGATGWSLSPEQLDRLTSASDRELPYPHSLLGRFRRR
ncbi:aldo/keto reductase [Rugosimonospora africana]|uniref:Oxidoreductase n=1 Tax=Rugosimonospora africana TaxID=556532 RepID=A0A8J3QNX6_9ACTN|nr:aldo/keto reductase [Rugosimonospora africana]GIH13027.1 oxidoreductase [Rugosimonospora africana]